jgi:hypothetical protein
VAWLTRGREAIGKLLKSGFPKLVTEAKYLWFNKLLKEMTKDVTEMVQSLLKVQQVVVSKRVLFVYLLAQ